jgi:hypothetical protein
MAFDGEYLYKVKARHILASPYLLFVMLWLDIRN